ncbi:MAG: peptide chain release factor N(5)-glutamine methyltransferase [Planctomycetota bacterium]
MTDELWTIKRLLDWTTDFFKSKELEQPRLCAEILLADSLKCQRIDLYTRFNEVPDEQPLARYRDWVKRHAKGEPVAYLVGFKEFYSMRFTVNSHVLIPRPETEHVVMAAIEVTKEIQNRPIRILDIGTGSGCIAITLAKQIENSQITACDISADALAVAELNSIENEVEIEFLLSDLFDAVETGTKVDFIVSNPPYIGLAEESSVDESVKNFEPHQALFAGQNGLDVISRLVEQSPRFLNPNGFLIFETSPVIFDQCLELIESNNQFGPVKTIRDFANLRRVIQAQIL